MDTGTHWGSAATGITTRLANAPSQIQPQVTARSATPQNLLQEMRRCFCEGDHLKRLLHSARASQDTAFLFIPSNAYSFSCLNKRWDFFFLSFITVRKEVMLTGS